MTASTATPRPTLKTIPPMNPELSLLENNLELSALEEMGDGVFTNSRPLWKPDDARGIYGGCVSVSRRQLASCVVRRIANKVPIYRSLRNASKQPKAQYQRISKSTACTATSSSPETPPFLSYTTSSAYGLGALSPHGRFRRGSAASASSPPPARLCGRR